jgi:phage tail sheath protein FI
MSAIGGADLGTSDVRIIATCYDQLRAATISSRTYNIPKGTLSVSASNGATTMKGLSKILGGAMDADRIGIFSDSSSVDASTFIVNPAAGGLCTMELSAGIEQADGTYVPGPIFQVVNHQGGWGGVGVASVTASGLSINTEDAAYLVQSLWPGEGYNAGTEADGSTSGVSFEVQVNGANTNVDQVNNLGTAVETYKTGMLSSAFLETDIGTTYAGRTSDYITAAIDIDDGAGVSVTALTSFEKPLKDLGALGTLAGTQGGVATVDSNPRFAKLVQGTYNLAAGTNGIPATENGVATAVIGEVESDGGKTGIEALDDDVLNISIALAPGTGVGDLQTVQNALITKAEATSNFLALISPPYAVGRPGDAIDWSNGFATTRDSAVNSSYAAIYWPWLQVFSVADGVNRWLAPEIFAARQMTYTDEVADPWWAPAGFVRGRLTKPTDVEVILNQGDRDSMYSGGNCLNPIVNFPQNGIAIFGQRTSQRQPTALDRINVRRLMIYIKKVLLASTQRLVFEPNDRFTWARVQDLVNPLLGDIANRRGITEYRVICDASVNTPVRVDRNEMWCKVLIKPTKTAEMVIFELNLTNQSAQF